MLKNKKHNWLLIASLIGLITMIVMSLYSDEDIKNIELIRGTSSISTILIIACIFAPLIEEVAFRLPLIKKLKHKAFFGFFLLIPLLLFNLDSVQPAKIVIITLFLAMYIIERITETHFWIYPVYLLNAMLFSIAHVDTIDFTDVDTISRISPGFLFIWISINLGITKSIVSHSIWNFLLFTPILFFHWLNHDTQYSKEFLNNNFIELTPVSIFDDQQSGRTNGDTNYIKGNMFHILKYLDIEKNEYMVNDSPFGRYELKYVIRDTSVFKEDFKSLLIENELLNPQKNNP